MFNKNKFLLQLPLSLTLRISITYNINKILDYQPNKNQATKVELMEWFQLGIFAANAPAITTFTSGIGVNVGGGIIDDSNNNMGL